MKKNYQKLKQAFADDPEMLAQINHEEMMEQMNERKKTDFFEKMELAFKGQDGYTPVKGIDYFDGEDGYTPIKGVDYFDGKDGYTPIKGKDYFDGKDGKNADENLIIQKVLSRVPTFKELQPLEIANGLNSLKEVINVSTIKGLPTVIDIVNEIKKNRLLELRDIKGARLDMNDQRWHGGGLSTVSHDSTLSGDGTPESPLTVVSSSGISLQTDGIVNTDQTILNLISGSNITLTADAFGGVTIASTGGGGGSPGGSSTQLQWNNAGSFGGITGATTNGTAVTYTTTNLIAADIKANASGGFQILSNAGTVTALFGAGGGANSTFYGGAKFDYSTASTVPYFDASKNLISSAVTPTELGYLSGVTSAIQTQLNGKQASGTYVTAITISSTNGFAGSSSGGATPALTISTSVTGLLKGNGTAISAASAGTDYVAPGAVTTSGLTMSTARLLGRSTAATGAIEEITIGSGLSLSAGTLSATGGGSSALSSITAATATNSIDNLNFAQTWDWSTMTTQVGFTLSANALSSGTIHEITSTSTAAPTTATYSGSHKAIGINLTGTNGTSSAVTYGLYVLNAKLGTTSQNYAIHADTTNASGLITNIPFMWTAYDGGGAKVGSRSSTEAAMWFKSVTPSTTNYTIAFDTSTVYFNSSFKVRSGASNQAGMTTGGIWFDSAGGNVATGGQRLISRNAATATANYGSISLGAQGNWAGGGTAPFAGSSSGTHFAINEASGYAGDFVNWQLAGATKFKVDNAGLITTNSTTMIASNQAFTNGAGASAGTLTNAPAVGNPTKWIPINDNGTTRYIPAW